MAATLVQSDPELHRLLDEIRRDFSDVVRGDAVTLHETLAIDHWGSEVERRKARELDTDKHWGEVRDGWIQKFDGVGGLCFLDDPGFRYYLPAYLSYWLRTDHAPFPLTGLIVGRRKWRYRLFTAAQRRTIGRVISFIHHRTARKRLPTPGPLTRGEG
jgi:hypothetical protein